MRAKTAEVIQFDRPGHSLLSKLATAKQQEQFMGYSKSKFLM
jgi:hypothetical protein